MSLFEPYPELSMEIPTADEVETSQPIDQRSRMLHLMSIVINNTEASTDNNCLRIQLSTSSETLPVQPSNALYNYKLFENRVATFPDKWKSKTRRMSLEMAAQGFFYIADDELMCAYCNKQVGSKCILIHNIELLHRVISPECTFFQKPFGPYIYYKYYESPFIYTNISHCVKFLKLEGVKPNSNFTDCRYSTVESRLETVNNWKNPFDVAPRVVSEFCKAGFFYTDDIDRFKCFCCGLTVTIIENSSNPWFSHSKFDTSCRLLILSKGRHFIDTARQLMDLKYEPLNDSSSLQEFVINLEHRRNRYAFLTNDENQLRLKSLTIKRKSKNRGKPGPFMNRIWTVNPKFMDEKLLCRICSKERLEVVFVPCGHLLVCIECSVCVTSCPVCRNPYKFAVRLFIFYAFNTDVNDESAVFFPSSESVLLCKLCNESEMEVALLPCKHVYCCFACAVNLKDCLLCGIKTIAYIRLYLS